MQVIREWSAASSPDSTEKILSYWADDAIVMPPGQQAVKGKDGYWKDVVDMWNAAKPNK